MPDRCKIGDIAVIIHEEVGCEANIGRFVHVEGPRKSSLRYGVLWRIRPVNGTTITYLDIDKKSIVIGPAEGIEHQDHWLLPVRPEELKPMETDLTQESPSCLEQPELEQVPSL